MRKAIAIVVAILVGLLVVEGIARIAYRRPDYHQTMLVDPLVGFRMPRGLAMESRDETGPFPYRLSRDGFRGPAMPDSPRPADDPTPRLLFVGDSFLNAFRVRDEHLMTTRTERAIAGRSGAARVFCISGDGFSPGQGLILFRAHAPTVRPDAVVLALYPGNDVHDGTPELHGPADYTRVWLVDGGDGVLHTTTLFPWRTRLRRWSVAFSVLEHRLVGSGVWARSLREPAGYDPRRFAEGRPPNEDLELYSPAIAESSAAWRAAWSTTEAVLRRFRDEAESLGARFLVVVIPAYRQAVRTGQSVLHDHDARTAAGRSLESILDLDFPERRIAAFAAREGIDVRLLLGPLRRATAPERPSCYVPEDGHLSGEGHRIAAEVVTAWWFGEPDRHGADLAGIGPGPTSLLPPRPARGAPEVLEPGDEPLLHDGWGPIRPATTPRPGTIVQQARAFLLVPVDDGALVVSGTVPRRASLPIHVRITVPGIPGEGRLTIESREPFTQRCPITLPPRLRPPAHTGHVPVVFECIDREPGEWGLMWGPVVHTIGFVGK